MRTGAWLNVQASSYGRPALLYSFLDWAVVYSTIESWSLIGVLCFTDYTLLTTGIGNIVSQTYFGRSLSWRWHRR